MWLSQGFRWIYPVHYLSNYGIKYLVRTMASAYVRCIPGDEKMQITVEYCHAGGTPRAFNLDRKQTEECGTAVSRLKTNLTKSLFKHRKKKKNLPGNSLHRNTLVDNLEDDLNVLMIDSNGHKIDLNLPNKYAWTEGNCLRIANTDIPISVNAPAIKLLPLSTSIMAGFPVFPKFELEFADLQYCVFQWETVKEEEEVLEAQAEGGTAESENNASGANETTLSLVVAKGERPQSQQIKSMDQIYTPTIADIGLRLKLICIPGTSDRMGKEDSILSEEVKPGPGLCPFETRHLYTQSKTDADMFRVMTYNLLADTYSDSCYAREVLFPYCPPYALDMDYRKQLILKEIVGYHADIICLQEVDRKVFESDLLPSLDLLNFTGSLKIKGQQGCEGVALFFHRSTFRIVSQDDITLTEVMLQEPSCSDIRAAVDKIPALLAKLQDRSTVLQTVVLESVKHPDRYICVANTHLYFHPEAGHIRLLQGAASLRHIQKVCQTYEQQGKNISVVFCGDFNCTPGRGIVRLMTEKHISSEDENWNAGDENEKISLDLQHDMDLVSACGFVSYTNYTPVFHGMLDYIFVDGKKLQVVSVVPMPTHEEVTVHAGLPSVVFPSDHIAQICDLTWTS